MPRVEQQIDLPADPKAVWDVVLDAEHFQDWVTIHRKLGPYDKGAAREGMKMEQTLCLRGVNFKVKWTLAESREPEYARWEGKGPAGSKSITEYTITPNADGTTHFNYVNEFFPPGGPLGRVASKALVGGVSERESGESLQRLKAYLQRQG